LLTRQVYDVLRQVYAEDKFIIIADKQFGLSPPVDEIIDLENIRGNFIIFTRFREESCSFLPRKAGRKWVFFDRFCNFLPGRIIILLNNGLVLIRNNITSTIATN